MKREGYIVFWNPERRFGFIETRTPAAAGGFLLDKFYLNQTRIEFSMLEDIKIGAFARFDVLDIKHQHRPDYVPSALKVQVFENEEQARFYQAVTEANAATTEAK